VGNASEAEVVLLHLPAASPTPRRSQTEAEDLDGHRCVRLDRLITVSWLAHAPPIPVINRFSRNRVER
jgi:hypothetical protein